MSKWFGKSRKYKKMIEPRSLSPSPLQQEMKPALLIVGPLVIMFFLLMYLGRNYMITQQEFEWFLILSLIGWTCSLIGIWAWQKEQAISHLLFDREFGFTERLHPRNEIYCKPEDVRLLIKPDVKLQNKTTFEDKLKSLGFDESLNKAILERVQNGSKYMYYFRHKHKFQGWNAKTSTVQEFDSHVLFTDEPFDDQFVFGVGQENWYGPIYYNHVHAESDNVKVLGWVNDPFTSLPMPICLLIHSSKRYKTLEAQNEKDYEEVDAQGRFIAMLHGLNEATRRQLEHMTELKNANFAGHSSMVELIHEGSKVDQEYYQIAMKPMPRGWARSPIFKGLVTIVSIVAVCFIIVYVLNWIGLLHVW